jgi:signal recognition particle subunit SRP54
MRQVVPEESGYNRQLTASLAEFLMFESLSQRLSDTVNRLRGRGRLTEENIRETLREVRIALLEADVALPVVKALVERVKVRAVGQEVLKSLSPGQALVKVVSDELTTLMGAANTELNLAAQPPAIVLMAGLQGAGKTTTVAKLAHLFARRGARVLLAAADTFRAAAIEQLEMWAKRIDIPVVAHAAGADPSAVVFDALDAATARGSDVVVIDTAGRLHTKSNLMEELAKIRRTIGKRLPDAQPEVLFVLDATTGQNGLIQARAFHEAAGLTGIALTKLDTTSRGGVAFAIEDALDVPVLYVGVGEKVDDLLEFSPNEFIEALFA